MDKNSDTRPDDQGRPDGQMVDGTEYQLSPTATTSIMNLVKWGRFCPALYEKAKQKKIPHIGLDETRRIFGLALRGFHKLRTSDAWGPVYIRPGRKAYFRRKELLDWIAAGMPSRADWNKSQCWPPGLGNTDKDCMGERQEK